MELTLLCILALFPTLGLAERVVAKMNDKLHNFPQKMKQKKFADQRKLISWHLLQLVGAGKLRNGSVTEKYSITFRSAGGGADSHVAQAIGSTYLVDILQNIG